jgi:parallel beta-helix repeat protein
MKKIIALGILILFALSCFLPSIAGFSSESAESFSFKSGSQAVGDIIIVDDEGDGDYTSIKDALNHSNPGDTIEVYSGTYYEHGIDIMKERITLQGIPYELGNGHDAGKPFINGEGKHYVIFFDAKNITLDSFHIENKDGTHDDIIDLSRNADGCIISNNDFAYTSMCFIYVKGSNNKIINNSISYSAMRQGILLRDPCSNCLVSGNVISDVEDGILLWDSNHNTITNNKIRRCRDFGIDIASGEYNTVEGNTLEDNTVGVQIYHSLGSRIKNNNFINNQLQAYFVYGITIFWCHTNRWNGNYWNSSRTLPYPIWGARIFFPWVQFDWRPAKEPYDI